MPTVIPMVEIVTTIAIVADAATIAIGNKIRCGNRKLQEVARVISGSSTESIVNGFFAIRPAP